MKKILIVGCGDIGLKVAALLKPRYQLFALVRQTGRNETLRAAGITPIFGDLDQRQSLTRLAGLADIVLHFAPPANAGKFDLRTRHLLSALSQRSAPQRLIYISTSGVYGDYGGAKVTETSRLKTQSARALRRVDAELSLRSWAMRQNVALNILRVPGIYAANRLPVERLHAGSPSILKEQDSFTNHIHTDDLARIVLATLRYGKPNRIYHATDHDELKMGDYFDLVADALHLPRPPRLTRDEVQQAVSPLMWSFMNESRRLSNKRLICELKFRLRYPTVGDFFVLKN